MKCSYKPMSGNVIPGFAKPPVKLNPSKTNLPMAGKILPPTKSAPSKIKIAAIAIAGIATVATLAKLIINKIKKSEKI